MVKRIGFMVAMVLVAILVLAACGSPNNEVKPTVTRIPDAANAPVVTTQPPGGGSAQPSQPTTGGGAPMTLDLTLEDIKFDKTELTVPADTQITVNLTNAGGATHNFNVDELNAHSGDVAGGATGTVTFNSGAAGEYTFYCNIPGHKEAGMVGKLVVTANAEGGAPGGAAASPAAGASPIAASPVPAQPAAPTEAPAAPAAQTTFDVAMIDINFDVKQITAPANSTVTINLTNNGAATHNFNVDELNVHSGDYQAGQTGTVTIQTGAPGTYAYYCNVPGHKEAGMVGQLVVQ